MEYTQAEVLQKRWDQLKAEKPKLRIRNAAQELGVSEVELLALNCGQNVFRLRPDFKDILSEVESLGKVMALSRNDEVVHERKGVYLNPSLDNAHVGLFVGEDIDLRIFFGPWDSAFAVQQMVREKPRFSLQFFAKDGEAVHKIYMTPQSKLAAYHALVEKYRHEDQGKTQRVEAFDPPAPETPIEEIDVAAFQQSWIDLKDTHHFFGLLKKHKLGRVQALEAAPEGNYAVKVGNQALRQTLNLAAEQAVPIMVFVGNRGMIQIHSGPVKKLLDYDKWFNVMDPDFNLHVDESAIAQSWVVRKPTEDGVVTALECFNAEGKQIVQFFGKRKPGIPELADWRDIMAQVELDNTLSQNQPNHVPTS
ncbi:MAG: ChuX/HutX family heme-like substrate-binding protein [Bacteroidota bacterium]